MGEKSFVLRCGQGVEEMVLSGIMWVSHKQAAFLFVIQDRMAPPMRPNEKFQIKQYGICSALYNTELSKRKSVKLLTQTGQSWDVQLLGFRCRTKDANGVRSSAPNRVFARPKYGLGTRFQAQENRFSDRLLDLSDNFRPSCYC